MNIIDIFSGCGGLSLGFEMAGFNILTAIEKDEWAATTYKINHKNTYVINKDITEITDFSILNINPNLNIDGIIGGPPCQGFSFNGKRDKNDPRNSLFMEFIRFVDYYKPKFFVMENVKGILTMKIRKNKLVKNLILEEYKKIGYNVKICMLNAAEFGVPQSRIRIFFIGIRNDIDFNEEKLIPKSTFTENNQVTIENAIMDLPEINASEGSEIAQYTKDAKNSYQKWARNKSQHVYNHVAMKHSKRLIERFEQIKFGQSVKDVEISYGQRKKGNTSITSGKSFSQNNMRCFPNKPSPTITASFQSNFVHPYFNRNYTAREGARLQSFPDNYIFYGKRTTMSWEKNLSQYQQIGNAVPPLLAFAIAKNLLDYFK